MSREPSPSPHDEPGTPRRRRYERRKTVFGPTGWIRRLARLWGFLGFVILVVVLARQVILPFIFALLIAYILAPLVDRMSVRADGKKRMHRGLAIIICYIVLLAAMASFVSILLPRLSNDVARIGREAPALLEKLDEKWLPQLARWLEKRFPSMAPPAPADKRPDGSESQDSTGEAPGPGNAAPDSRFHSIGPLDSLGQSAAGGPATADDPDLPPGTAFVLNRLPDGRTAVQIVERGLELTPQPNGAMHIAPAPENVEHVTTEDRLRAWARNALGGLQSQAGDFVRFGQALIGSLIRGVFMFFLVLMVAAFILIDIRKLHRFVRGLFPSSFRDDYDYIAAGINIGLSGVIRGQLLICLVNGILTYIGLVILGIKYQLILAVVACVMSLIPIFGSILSTVPIVLAALVSGDEGLDVMRAILSVAWIVGIHFIEANLLNPKIIGTAAKIHPVLVIFALIVGEHSYGLVGALLAVPVLSMIQVLFLFFRNKAWKHDDTEQDSLDGHQPNSLTDSLSDAGASPEPEPA